MSYDINSPTTIVLTPQEKSKICVDYLMDLIEKIKNGELLIDDFSQTRTVERWHGPDGWKFFNTGDISTTLTYHSPEQRNQELDKREAYRKANPTALEESVPYPVAALNGIPRGMCNDYNIEEGWVQYVVPKSGNYEDYSVGGAPMEMRRYYGKVTIIGYIDPAKNIPWESDPLREVYKRLPEGTPMLPIEPYEVVMWTPARWGKKILRLEPGYLGPIISNNQK